MAKIDELTFGSMVVEGKKYRRDVLIFADGAVARPNKPAEQKKQ